MSPAIVSQDMENGIFARKSEYLDCYVQIGIASGRVINVSFPSSPDENSEENGPLLDDIFSYLEGKRMDFTDIDVGLTISGDERRLLEKTREIPYGEQISVRQLVQMVSTLDSDSDDDIELARQTLAENPVPLIIPDHRVRDGPSAAPPGVEQKLRSLENL